jgi:hypothetical protein
VEPPDRLVPFGRVLFGAGIVLIVLRGLTLTTRMPGLPSFWYANQPLWLIIGSGMVAFGWRLLWGQSKPETLSWKPTVPGRRFHTTILYVGQGCHLCEEAAEILDLYLRWLPKAETIDIQSEPKLTERFCTCIPVVEFDGKVRFRGRINETLLRRLIDGTPPLDSN